MRAERTAHACFDQIQHHPNNGMVIALPIEIAAFRKIPPNEQA
jgi:hypothetical protein